LNQIIRFIQEVLRFHQIALYVHALVLTEAAAIHTVRRARKRLTCPGIRFRHIAKKPVVVSFEF
jgi:hypothetical protein